MNDKEEITRRIEQGKRIATDQQPAAEPLMTADEARHIYDELLSRGLPGRDHLVRLAGTWKDLRQQLTELQAWKLDIENSMTAALDETCDANERHCLCVALLRARVRELEGQVDQWKRRAAFNRSVALGGEVWTQLGEDRAASAAGKEPNAKTNDPAHVE